MISIPQNFIAPPTGIVTNQKSRTILAEVRGKQCNCPGAYLVDGLGLHMQKCKLEARLTIDTHTDVKREIAAFARFCGSTVRMEPMDMFRAEDLDDGDRVDLLIGNRSAHDVTIRNAVTREQETGRRHAAARAWETTAVRAKEAKYKVKVEAQGFHFRTDVFAVQGAWGEDFSKWFGAKLDYYSMEHTVPKAVLSNYWSRRLSVALHRGVARAQLGRCARLRNHYRWEEVTKRAQGDEALWHGVVEDQSVANVRGLHLSPGDDGADGFRIPDE
jgi:hypothetical protein